VKRELPVKRVIFICVHNAGRSQIAEAFFNQMAGGKAWAVSAGSKPADRVNQAAVEAMREVGLDISLNKPRLLTPELLDSVDMAITMGCGEDSACPAAWVKTEDWALEDPAGKPLETVRKIRDEIKRRVEKLITEIGEI
jgi:arsenate reductase (thioredoxin)